MSLDLAVGCFRDGAPAPLALDALCRAFAPLIVRVEPDALVLRTGPGADDLTWLGVDTAARTTTGFSLNRPGDDLRLFEGLLAVLREPGTVLMVPGDCPPLVGSDLTVDHLPRDLLDALGPPRVLHDAAEIPALVRMA